MTEKSINYSNDIWLRRDSKTGLYYLTTELRGIKFKDIGYPTWERYSIPHGALQNPRETKRIYISSSLLKYFINHLPERLDAELVKTRPWAFYLVSSNVFQTFIILLDTGGLSTIVEKLPRNARKALILQIIFAESLAL
ncbi:MAG: hypothetical protein ACUVQF_09820 [Fervidobacterium sp.]|uniref:hypothetical protein n=1 Tax=Fervidobacterium sp. TaxID=1871331 RepID=UPI0040492B9C